MPLSTAIRQQTQQLLDELVHLRRTIHQNPELGFEERETADLVASTLRRDGIRVEQGIGKTGVVALIEGGHAGRTVAVRADMDCLPIHEQTNLPFASRHEGRMHACGHDLHTAVGVGVARVLQMNRGDLKGQVKMIFQPAEEILAGAQAMLRDGVLEHPEVDAIVGFHNWPTLETGKIGYTPGVAMASSDTFTLSLKGVSGHAAYPHAAVDPITGAAYFITQLQTIVSREVAPTRPAVVTVGQINSGTASNIIPDRLTLTGTVRTLDMEARGQIEVAMRRMLEGLKTGTRLAYELEYRPQVPVLRNDRDLQTRVTESARGMLGDDKVVELAEASMGSEDFACYSERIPGVYLRLGSMIAGHDRMLHNSDFQPNEGAIAVGVEVLSRAAVDLLG